MIYLADVDSNDGNDDHYDYSDDDLGIDDDVDDANHDEVIAVLLQFG